MPRPQGPGRDEERGKQAWSGPRRAGLLSGKQLLPSSSDCSYKNLQAASLDLPEKGNWDFYLKSPNFETMTFNSKNLK